MKYLVKLTLLDTTFKTLKEVENPNLDEEVCKYYADGGDEKIWWKTKCKHCYGKGILTGNHPAKGVISYTQACYCVQKNMEKQKIELDDLIIE